MTSNTEFNLTLVENSPVTLMKWTPDYVLTVHGEDGKPLAKILANGAVEMDESNANTAAKIFWQAIHFTRPHCPNCNSELQLV